MAFIIGQGIDIGSGITITYEYPVAPSVIVNPYISGTAQVRVTLTVYPGTWDPGIPKPILGYYYQWQYGTTDIPGATSNTLTVPYTVVGQALRCKVTAYNDALQTDAYTVYTANVIPNVPAPVVSPTATNGTLGSVNIAFTPNVDNGGANVDIFYASSNTGGYVASNNSSPITITPGNLGTYTFDVVAHNSVGNSSPSTTNSVTVSLTPTSTGTVSLPAKPLGVVASPDNKFVYVLVTGAIRWYSVNATTGALTYISQLTYFGGDAGWITMNSAGTSVWVSLPGGTNIATYTRNITTGALTAAGTDTFSGTGCDRLAQSPDGKWLFAAGFAISTGYRMVRGYSVNPSGGLSSTGPLVSLDTDTGGTQCRGMEVSMDNNYMYLQIYNPGLTIRRIYKFSVNQSNGALTNQGYITSPVSSPASNMALTYDNKDLLVAYGFGGQLTRFNRDIATGNLTINGNVSSGNISTLQAIIPTTDNIVYTGAGSFLRDINTGNLTYTNANSALTFSNVGDEGVITKNNTFIYTIDSGANLVHQYKVV